MRELTECVMERLLEEYEGVIYAALKKVGWKKSNQLYEDFYQVGCLKLFEAYQTCAKDPLLEENRYQFVSYAGQRIRWAILDELRGLTYRKQHEEFQQEEAAFKEVVLPTYEEDLAFKEYLNAVVAVLNEKETAFLMDRLYYGLNMTDIAKKRNVSRKTVHVWRKKVQEKVAGL